MLHFNVKWHGDQFKILSISRPAIHIVDTLWNWTWKAVFLLVKHHLPLQKKAFAHVKTSYESAAAKKWVRPRLMSKTLNTCRVAAKAMPCYVRMMY